MIIIDTKLNRIPSKCNECKYSHTVGQIGRIERFCSVVSTKGICRPCPIKLVSGHWQYVRPDWCPIREISIGNT